MHFKLPCLVDVSFFQADSMLLPFMHSTHALEVQTFRMGDLSQSLGNWWKQSYMQNCHCLACLVDLKARLSVTKAEDHVQWCESKCTVTGFPVSSAPASWHKPSAQLCFKAALHLLQVCFLFSLQAQTPDRSSPQILLLSGIRSGAPRGFPVWDKFLKFLARQRCTEGSSSSSHHHTALPKILRVFAHIVVSRRQRSSPLNALQYRAEDQGCFGKAESRTHLDGYRSRHTLALKIYHKTMKNTATSPETKASCNL